MNALTFAVILPALLVAHHVGDHWLQTDYQAQQKGSAGWAGRLACARHVTTYTAVTAGAVALVWWLFALPISPWWFAVGQLVSAVTHYWADRRFTLAGLCERIGKGDFYRLGSPRAAASAHAVYERDTEVYLHHEGQIVGWDNPTLGTGAYALDQSWHWAWLMVAALITAV